MFRFRALWPFLVLLAPLLAQAAEPRLGWPLDLSPQAITGTFMEARSAHYHSGLDLKTAGRTGIPVLAPAAGDVVRVRVSPHGYGMALYLQIDDGRTLVFAHLSRFQDRIQARITAAQRRGGRYTQDLYLEPRELRFEAGDQIALSGSTGTGAPHLHFEVRDAGERPQNPILQGLEVPDERPPTIRGFRVVPLEEQSRVDGRARTARVDVGGDVVAQGALGIQVDVLDHTGIFNHRLMPLAVELWVDDARVYRLEQRAFAFSQGRQMRLEIVRDENRRRWLRLYPHGPNDLPHREGPGRFMAEGRHQVEVRAFDAAGHQTRAGFQIIATGASPPRRRGLSIDEAVLEIVDDPSTAHRLVAPGLGAMPLDLDQFGVAAVPLSRLRSGPVQVGETQGSSILLGGDSVEDLPLVDDRVWVSDPNGKGTFPGGALWVEPAHRPSELPPGTRPVGPTFRLDGSGLAFRDHLVVSLRGEYAEQTCGFLFDEAENEWDALPTEYREDADVWRVEVDGLGVLALLQDSRAPTISNFEAAGRALKDGSRVNRRTESAPADFSLPPWPVVSVGVADAGAGLPDDALVTELDGAPYPARWDPEEERVYFDWYVEPPPGEHELRVVATDRVGNRVERNVRILLR